MDLKSFRLERFFAKYEFAVKYLLCSSDCESLAVQDLLDLEPGAAEELSRLWLGYTESLGSPELRREISGIYQGISPDEILVHSGAEEAIFLFMQAALTAGDHVIVHSPCYQSLEEIPRGLGCGVTRWTGRESERWALDLDELVALLRPNTRVVVINTPHNPTGYLMDRAAFLRLNELLRERGVWLFSDEVYRESEHHTGDRLPSACEINPLAVSLGVMSKTYGLAGLRIGWIATHNRPIYQRMAELKDYTSICNSAPSEFLACLALHHRVQIAERNRRILRDNCALLDEFFARHADTFSWVRPKAGSIAFPRYLGGDVDSFCDQLVRKQGVLLAPGALFGDSGAHFRIGFGRRNMPEALALLESYIS